MNANFDEFYRDGTIHAPSACNCNFDTMEQQILHSIFASASQCGNESRMMESLETTPTRHFSHDVLFTHPLLSIPNSLGIFS